MEVEEQHARQVDEPGAPKGGVVAEVLGDAAAREDPQPHPDVPRDEQRRVSRTAPLVRREVQEHRLKGGEHVAVAEADNEGRAVVAPAVVQRREEQIAQQRNRHAARGILHDAAAAQRAAADETREDQPDR